MAKTWIPQIIRDLFKNAFTLDVAPEPREPQFPQSGIILVPGLPAGNQRHYPEIVPTCPHLTWIAKTGSAIHKIQEAFRGLEMLGWSDIHSCPFNEEVYLLEMGSTGIHRGVRFLGVGWEIIDDVDSWPANPYAWAKIPKNK